MSYDIPFRYQQALDPSALITLPNALHALNAAIEDCRNAGRPHDSDPAVILLARHLGTLASQIQRPNSELRVACMEAIADLRRKPALIALANKGVAYDERAKKLFHADGRKALRALADALGLADDGYTITSQRGGAAISGDVMLHADHLYVRLSLDGMGAGREVMFRKVAGRHDFVGERNYWAAVHDFVQPKRLAARIRRDLNLPEPAGATARLAA
ncbi:hypothetical protein SAMN06295912_11282 [Sphingomonas laterariae]|uniref:Uncharacterized protein n=1 Tax=Edaphosphingomonas laterariae TaxID=861865 RepID=A0A239GHU6_9SPHN|nr:hypothetical protein [Sphingomonas laterariae]SNS68720.1 hypothetical protein SAMN06295912_11282 [Sphingomonas laterariae]